MEPFQQDAPCEPLYRFNQHGINPELQTIVNLVVVEEFDVLGNNDGRSVEVDTVAPIHSS